MRFVSGSAWEIRRASSAPEMRAGLMKDRGREVGVVLAVSLSWSRLRKKGAWEFGDVGELKKKKDVDDVGDVGDAGEVGFVFGLAASLVTGAPVLCEMKIGRPSVSLEKSDAVDEAIFAGDMDHYAAHLTD